MILLLGGTTEAKQVASYFDEQGIDYVYSTRTNVKFEGKGAYRSGGLDAAQLLQFCRSQRVSLIIDACHPFAEELHQTVAAITAQIPGIRFERALTERIIHPLVQYRRNYKEILISIEEQNYQSMLALTGVQSIPLLSSFWQHHPCWFRILNRKESIDFATRYHFPATHLRFGLPQEKEQEITLFKELNPQVILSKESGLNGKLTAKTEAAIACNIPIFILEKPEVPALLKVVHNLPELLTMIS